MTPPARALDPAIVSGVVQAALLEDVADNDITTNALVPAGRRGRAVIVARAAGIVAGLDVARAAFEACDPTLRWRQALSDGQPLSPGDRIATVEGALAPILRAERVALNFLTHLSGVATAADAVVRALEGTGCRLRDTRKTLPGLRALQKYAVVAGGGTNHRMDLSDGVLIKDNHLAAVRARGLGIADAVRLAREANPGKRIEIEVTSVDEAREALDAGAGELLLDNMPPDQMREVARLASVRKPRPALEASGGITLENAREIAETGVAFISMGAITHSVKALDMSLEVEAG
jgi:nicotinate-nucleotide pyrophosphorylase (carboxylating)